MNSHSNFPPRPSAIGAAGQRLAVKCELARCGFTEPGFAVAAALLARGPLLRSRLAAAAGLSEPRTNAALARLEMSLLVGRERDRRDRRMVRLRLTRRGRARTARALRRCGECAAAAESPNQLAP